MAITGNDLLNKRRGTTNDKSAATVTGEDLLKKWRPNQNVSTDGGSPISKEESTKPDGTEAEYKKYFENIDAGKAAQGWQKYLADQEAAKNAPKYDLNNDGKDSWWEKALGYLGGSGGGVVDTTLPTAGVTQTVHDLRADESYRRPKDDWSEEQRNAFGALYATSPDMAYDFADQTNKRNAKAKEEAALQKITDSATSSFGAGVGHTLGALATAPLGLADYLNDLAMSNAGRDIAPDGHISPFEYSQAVTGGIGEHLNEKFGTIDEDVWVLGGKGLGDLYGLGTSIAQSMASAYTMGPGGALVSYFGQGAAAGVDEALARGATDWQAALYGISLGAFEGIAESIGIDNLFKLGPTTTIKGYLKNILKQAGAEGMEEGLTALLGNIADNAIMQDKSNFSFLVAQYMAQGMSESEATNKAWLTTIGDIAFDTIAGAASGATSGGIHTTAQSIASNIDAKKMYGDGADLVIEAMDIDPTNEFAQKMQARVDAGKSLSGSQINRLVESNEQAIKTQDTAKMKSAVEARLTELGESGDIGTLADVIVKAQSGEKLTSAESSVLVNSKYGRRVSTELNPQSIASGEYTSKWAENIGTERINVEAYNRDLYALAQDVTNATSENALSQAEASAQQAGTVSPTENAPTKEIATEGKFEASTDGKTRIGDTEVTIKEIASVKNGEMILRLEDGSTVQANDVEYGSSEEALIYENVLHMDLNAATANAFVNGYDGSIPAAEYALGFREAYMYGGYGFPAEQMSGNGFSAKLPEAQRSLAYGLGKTDAKYKISQQQSATTKIASTVANNPAKDSKKTKAKGKVHYDGVTKGLTERQQASVKGLETIAEALGVDIYLFESEVNEKGQRKGANGWYDPNDGSIHIDVYAGLKGEGTILFTAAHELTHFIRQWSPAKFKAFADFLLEQYGQKGISVDALVRNQIEKAKRKGRTIDFDTAYEEVIADSCEMMLSDGEVIQKLAELKAKDKTLWEKIKSFIADLVAKIKAVYEGLSPDSIEGRYVAEMLDAATNLKTMFTDALVDAGETYSEVREALGEGSTIEVNEKGEFTVGKTKDGTFLYNDRTYDEGGRETLKATLKAEGYSDEDIDAALAVLDAKHDLVKRLGKVYTQQDIVNHATLTTDLKNGLAVLSAIVSNGDYPVNIDLSMVCKKRIAYQKVINRLCESGLIKKAALDSLAIAEINKILGKYGFETACLGCFVESRRIRIQEWAETICKEWNGIVDKMVGKGNAKEFGFAKETFVKDLSNDEVQALSAELDSAYERDGLHYGRATVVKKMEQLLREVPSLRKHLTVADLITPTGRTHIKSLSAELNSLIACRYGSNTPKIVQDFNPYNHELAQYGKVPKGYDSLRDYLYAIGGARMQSFSDFIVENWFDYCQIVADLAARKLPMHTYTKEISLAKLFGMTGIKVNMSLIPDIDRSLGKEYAGLTKNAKGEYELIFADKDRFKATGGKSYMQSINFADAVALQNDPRYSANVGTIAVGISDKHIRMMLGDSRIRMVIPYHSSGMNPIFAHLVGTDYYTDYTNVQNTGVAYLIDSKGNKKNLKLDKTQKGKLTSGFEFNAVLQELGDARETAKAYLDWCADASQHTITIDGETYTAVLTPKFEQFSDHENYYKLLEDFNTYDSITEQAAPQGDVQQIYPEDFDSILEAEIRSRDNYRKKQAPKWETAMGEIEGYLKTHKKADTVAYAKEHGIKLSKKDMKLSDRVTDPETLDFLNDQIERGEYITVYRSFQIIDGGLYAPMNAVDRDENGKNRKLGYRSEIGQWEMATESRAIAQKYMDAHPDAPYAKFDLDGVDNKTGGVAYNPYLHASNLVLNDQFSAAYRRNLVTVECRVPLSEAGGAYKADYAKDGTGWAEWKSGKVAGELKKKKPDFERKLFLSRYMLPYRILSDSEVASMYKEYLDGTDVPVPWNVVTPSLRKELEKAGVNISYADVKQSNGSVKFAEKFPEEADKVLYSDREIQPITESEIKDLAKHFGTTGNFKVAGYLLTDGKLLDFSGKHWGDTTSRSRQVDHRDVQEVIGNRDSMNGTNAMIDMIGSGNIRLMPEDGGINLAVYPNEKQRRVLSAYINYMLATEGQVIIDYDAVGGDTVYSREYGKTATSRQILTDIRNYFNGARQSDLMRFHTMYSDRDTDSVSNRSLLANALESVAKNDIERAKLAQYKSKLALIESEQAKLAETKAKIKELSFAKGRRDTEAIKKLQFEANQTANRINTYDRQLLNLEATAALKGVLQREKQLAYKKAEREGKEALARYREKAADTQRELLTRYQESRKKGIEGRKKTEMRHKIKGVVSELNQYLLKGTKEKHVPIELQKAVAEALDAVNMDTVNAEERIAKKRDEMLKAKTPEAIEKLAKEIANIREMGGNMASKISSLKTAYDSIINSDDPLIANSHDAVISNSIDKVVEVIGNTPLRDMELFQLEAVYDLYKMVLHSIRAANKAFKAEKGESIAILANGVIAELEEKKRKSPYTTKAKDKLSEFDWNNQKPVYAFERIGSANFTKVFNAVRAGEDVWAKDMDEAQAFREEQFKKYKYDSWDFKKRYRFTSTSGKSFELSLDQILSLYAFSKRAQAGDHLKYGGFVFDGLSEVKAKNKVGMTVTYQLKDATAYNLSEETLHEIIGKLTPAQKEFADTMQDYLSTVMGEKGNEVSLALYDIKLFKEKYYFPLKSAPQYLAKAKEQAQGEVKIKNSGFTKETTPNAKNPIVLSSFMDVWAGHVNEMSMYHAFTLPLEDFYRVYNYHTPADEKMSEMSVGSSLENAHGQAAVKYIDQLLKDLNGGARSDPRETLGKSMMSNFKKAAVMASMSVVVQQPTAIVRATAVVDSKYFLGKNPTKKKHKDAWAEVKKYAPVAVIKEMGYFDTGMGQGSVEWLKGEKTFMDKVDDATSKLPALADEVTWVAIWNAVKRETVHTHKHLAPNSDAFLKVVGERFTEVVTKTQVYDSTLSRSANMRSKSTFMNMVTSFLAEPTTSINMLQDAFHKGNKKRIARTMAAVYGSVILNAALVSLVYAMRDDDEDETFLEKYLSRFTTEVLDGANPVTYLPFVKDIWSAAQGFDIERADMSLITDLIGSFQQATKVFSKDTSDMDEDEFEAHKKDVAGSILGIMDNFSSLAGIPVKNIRREINGAINAFKTIGMDLDGRQTTAGSLGDTILGDVKDSTPVWGWFPDKSKGDKLYDAIIKGDEAYIDRFKSGYKSEDSYHSAVGKTVREHLEDGDLTATEAVQILVNYGGKDEAEAASKVHYWEFKMDYPDYDLSEEAVAKYYTDVEPWGINMALYYDYYKQKAQCKGYDDDGDGRADSGTKKAEIMEVIDSLPITDEQKDALYLLNGWSESTLWQAPWH